MTNSSITEMAEFPQQDTAADNAAFDGDHGPTVVEEQNHPTSPESSVSISIPEHAQAAQMGTEAVMVSVEAPVAGTSSLFSARISSPVEIHPVQGENNMEHNIPVFFKILRPIRLTEPKEFWQE